MKILVVDDDKNIVEAITIGFQLQWQEVEVLTAPDGEKGLDMFYENNPDIILLDVMMPHKDGFTALKEIRRTSDVPIIMLTARGDELDKVKGLELGSDDYLTKPFSHLELFARIKAVLRRAEMPPPMNAMPSFVSGDISINFENREVLKKAIPIKMTPTEYSLLFLLARNAGRVVPFETLLDKVWGPEYREQLDYLKTYLSRLRKKLEDDPENPRYLITERGLGYRFVKIGGK
ncbi:MAG: response regulator transcription factor [Chloroflexi bacterium]|uniref:Response regulator transcription factor n=1 Tax=Candidatus Chlorohelix allophototropha TaxID=3003348 RepID=A0A8T7M8S5_9CHLR|nr:response regulator transcription factor [Chloroflexota bacterium]WJW68337.1 response regulator transcription factor [Chloroflexota bacterium L227-S17]